MDRESLSRYLIAKAREAGSKAKLAAAMGEHRPTLAKVINGDRDPTQKILDYLRMRVGYEFVGLPKRPETESLGGTMHAKDEEGAR